MLVKQLLIAIYTKELTRIFLRQLNKRKNKRVVEKN